MTTIATLLETITGQSQADSDRLTPARKRAYAWARVSTESQEQKGLSIPQQLKEIRAFAEREGIEIVEEFQEAASAYQHEEKRVKFNGMIRRAIGDPDISVILVHEHSRFSRNYVQGITLISELKAAEVEVLSATEPNFDTDSIHGLFMGAITQASNEVTSRKIGEHVKKGCTANIQTRDPETGLCYKNGGKALWGYKTKHLERGKGKGGHPVFKTVWVKDDTIVASKPIHEWARICLVEYAMKGASYADLRDFCNEKGIPGRQDAYWGHHAWKDLLELKNLLQYAGYGVWSTRSKTVRRLPPSEWVTVKDAHSAIITEEEATAIYGVRMTARKKAESRGFGRTRTSNYLLSGGVFTCDRCGRNMIGHMTYRGTHYVCGSQPYRRGLGCGKGVYVPQDLVETEVMTGIEALLENILKHTNLVKKVNRELRAMWANCNGQDQDIVKQLKEIERKIENVRKAILEGLQDTAWANAQMSELQRDRDRLMRQTKVQKPSKPFQADMALIRLHVVDLDRVFKEGTLPERKKVISDMVQTMTLTPDERHVAIQYRLPDHLLSYTPPKFMNSGGTVSSAPTTKTPLLSPCAV